MTVTEQVTRRVDGEYITENVELTGDKLAEFNARKSAPRPKRRKGEFREFLALFTTNEQIAIKTASMNPDNVALALWYDKALGGAEMSLDHPDTATGLSALVSAGLIDADRKAEILTADFNAV